MQERQNDQRVDDDINDINQAALFFSLQIGKCETKVY